MGDENFDLMLPDDDSQFKCKRVDGLWQHGQKVIYLGLLYNNEFGIDQLPENGAEITPEI